MSFGFISTSLSIASVLAGANLEFETIVRTETRTGVEPASNNPAGTVPVVDLELQPAGEMSILATDQALSLRYRPRIFYRAPNGQGHPLLLNQAEGLWRWRMTPDVRWTVSGYLAFGDVSYGRLVDGSDQATGGTTSPNGFDPNLVVTTLSEIVLGAVLVRISGNQTLTVDFRGQYTQARTLSTAPPDQITAFVAPTYIQSLTRTDDLQVGMTMNEVSFIRHQNTVTSCPTSTMISAAHTSTVTNLPSVGASIGWRHRFTNRTYLITHVGFTALLSDFSQSTPTFDFLVNSTLLGDQNLHLDAAVSAGVEAFANPIFESFGPRGSSSLNVEVIWQPHLDARLTLAVYTPLRTAAANGCPYAQQTIFSARLPVVWTFDDQFQLEVGARMQERGPNLGESSITMPAAGAVINTFSQLELLAYAAFTVTLGKGAEQPGIDAGR